MRGIFPTLAPFCVNRYICTMSTDTQPKTKRSRGRQPLGDEKLIQTAFRFTAEQLEWLDAQSERRGRIGRNAVLRQLVDEARKS